MRLWSLIRRRGVPAARLAGERKSKSADANAECASQSELASWGATEENVSAVRRQDDLALILVPVCPGSEPEGGRTLLE